MQIALQIAFPVGVGWNCAALSLVTSARNCVQSRRSLVEETKWGNELPLRLPAWLASRRRVWSRTSISKRSWRRMTSGFARAPESASGITSIPGTATSHLATEAAKQLLAQRNVQPEEIDMIIVASVTPDMMFPATACLVQDRLGAKHAWGFDLSAACSGFVYALTVGAQFVGSGYAQESAGDRKRCDEFHPRFQRPRHLRAVRRCRRRGAG